MSQAGKWIVTAGILLSLSLPGKGQTAPQGIEDRYKKTAQQIIDAALSDTDGYADLTYLCDHIGNRINGSEPLQQAVVWAAKRMAEKGLTNVSTPPVSVPHWIRGHEEAFIVSPISRKLHILGAGMSVGTPADGISAEIVAVSSFEELEALGASQVKGKIVVFNEPWKDYGQAVAYRVTGGSRAAKLGAVAVLFRSATGVSLQSPHTGTLFYDDKAPKIPVAALSVEDAALLARLAGEKHPVKVHLKMDARQEKDAESANVIGELRGSEDPEHIVVIGGHIDSWDVGQGAQDDGAGIIASLEAVTLLKKLGLQPRRTIRVVFWTNEESGASGAKAYRQWVGDKVKNHVAAIEMDTGAEAPIGIGFGGHFGGKSSANTTDKKSLELVKQIAALLKPIGADSVQAGGGGTDVDPITAEGVAGLRPATVGTKYFDWHHTEADTLDKVNLEDFRKNIAELSVLTYILADMPEVLVGEKSQKE